MWRCCTGKGSSSGFSGVSPTKVEACVFFTESTLVLKINNTWLIFIVTVYSYVTAYPRVSIFLSFRKYSFIMYMNFCNLWAKFVSYQNKSKFWVGLPYRRDCMIWTSYSELQMNIFKRNFNKKFTLQLKTGKRPLCLEASIWSDKFEWVPWSPIFSLCPKLYVWPEITKICKTLFPILQDGFCSPRSPQGGHLHSGLSKHVQCFPTC